MQLIRCLLRREWLLAVGLSVLAAACSSSRICGYTTPGAISVADAHDRKFRIVDLRVSIDTGLKDYPYVFPCAACTPVVQMTEAIHAVRPDVFASRDDAERICVNLIMKSGRKEGAASWLLYCFSLGVLPGWNDFISEGVAEVSLADDRAKSGHTAETPMRFESNQKMTCYSPIGLIPYGDQPTATSMRKGYMPDENALTAVFAETAANAIAHAVGQLCNRPKAIQPLPAQTAPPLASKTVQKANATAIREADDQMNVQTSHTCPECGAKTDADGKCPLCN